MILICRISKERCVMSKRNEITAQTKQNLIDAFWSLYCEKQIGKITVKDITDKAGYSRCTFYEYFSDVYDVLDQIESALIPSLDELPPVLTPSGSLGMPLETFFDLYKKNNKYFPVLLGESGDPAFASKLKKSIKPIIMKVFDDRPDINRKELDYIMEFTLSAMIEIMSYSFKQSDPLTNEQLHELISRLMEQGVMKQLPL